MASSEQLDALRKGTQAWGLWRKQNPNAAIDLVQADLVGADLRGVDLADADLRNADLRRSNLGGADLRNADLRNANLRNADLRNANLRNADLREAKLREAKLVETNLSGAKLGGAQLDEAQLSGADLSGADLSGANLSEAHLNRADLSDAQLRGADLRGADLYRANLYRANLRDADLSDADLSQASCVRTCFVSANLTNSRVYGVSVWNLELNDTTQQANLFITPREESAITVDNLEVAQFIYLMLNNERIRQVIDTIAKKVVLILGRFTPERKQVLDALRGELRRRDYLPVVFDFEQPSSRDLTETVSTLAHMARFVIADITDARSISAELEHIVPNLPSVAVKLIMDTSDTEFAMAKHLHRFPWVLETYHYTSIAELLAALSVHVIDPAERRANELLPPN